jgi:maleate isomerase
MEKVGKRIGLLLPASNSTMEKELARYLPSGVSLHVNRMHVGEVNPEELLAMSKMAPDTAKLLAECKPDLLLYGCTSGSFILGKGFDVELEENITKATGLPVITTSRAVLELFASYGIKKIAVGTPYIDSVNERMEGFLTDNGIEVVKMTGLGLLDNTDIGRLTPWDAMKLAEEADHEDADAVFLSCTNMQTLESLSAMSALLGKPVLSSNYASLLQCIQMLGYPKESWLGVDLKEELLRRYF